MTTATIIAGDLTANLEERVVSGLLLPFGEVGSTNLGRFEVPGPGVIKIPADVSVLNANEHHDPLEPRARFLTATETPGGVVATFRVGKTPEGDRLLARIDEGKKKGKPVALSVECKRMVIKDGKAVGGEMTGAAFVDRGAFPSAALLAEAVDTPELPEPPAPGEDPIETETTTTDEYVDEDGVTHKRTITRTEKVETDEDGNTTTTITETVVIEEPGEEPAEEEEATVPNATIPSTLAAAKASATKAKEEKTELKASNVFDMLTKVMTGQDDGGRLMAALTDIKISGASQLPTGGNAVQPAWLGEVFSQKAYQRRYMPLIRQGDIVAIDEKGFTVSTGSEPVQAWSGNKAELPSASGTTSAVSSVFQRWAVANDIAREFYDIPAGRAVIEAYIRMLVNSYARVTDYWTLAQMITAAGTQVDYDGTDIPTEYSAAMAKVITAIDLVDDTDAEPTFVIVAADVWSELRFTPKDQIPEYVTFSLRRTEGEADGGVVVLKDKAGELDAGQVLAGGREAAHVNELPGASPMQLDALDIAHGGIDKAVLGYTQFMAEYPDALVLLGDGEE